MTDATGRDAPGPLARFLIDGDTPMGWTDVAITVTAIAVPAIVAVLIFGPVGAAAFVAAMPAHIGARDRGVTVGFLAVSVTGLAGLLCLAAPDLSPIIGAMLGLMTAAAGRYGYARPCVAALITWCVFTSPILPPDPGAVLPIFLSGMLFSLAITALTGRAGDVGEGGSDEAPEAREHALIFGALLATGLGLSVWIGQRYFGQHGFWFPLTFVVLLMPPHGKLFLRTLQRTAGTLVGTAVAVGIAGMSDALWVTIAAGAVALPLAFRTKPLSYTTFTAFLTVVVLELLTLTTDIGQLAVERLGTMAAAGAMALCLGLLAAGILRVAAPKTFAAVAAGA